MIISFLRSILFSIRDNIAYVCITLCHNMRVFLFNKIMILFYSFLDQPTVESVPFNHQRFYYYPTIRPNAWNMFCFWSFFCTTVSSKEVEWSKFAHNLHNLHDRGSKSHFLYFILHIQSTHNAERPSTSIVSELVFFRQISKTKNGGHFGRIKKRVHIWISTKNIVPNVFGSDWKLSHSSSLALI